LITHTLRRLRTLKRRYDPADLFHLNQNTAPHPGQPDHERGRPAMTETDATTDAKTDAFQLSHQAAEVYETRFVPALFAKWAPHLLDAAGVAPGHTVLDVACGTGIGARHAADRLQGRGRVIGIDLNEAMLAVARRLRPDIDWRVADAAALPLPDRSVDTVLCQAALMFFPDPARALREMARVTAPTGTIAVQVWSSLDTQTGWAPFYDVVRRHAGPDAITLLDSYWRLGDLHSLTTLATTAGLRITHTRTRRDTATYPSADEFVATEITGTPLHNRISSDVYTRIVDDTRTALAALRTPTGPLEIPIEGHILTAHPNIAASSGPAGSGASTRTWSWCRSSL
jgi:ubiquinone/menaquinone biosynthesis C-methylase UbiE